MEANDLITYFCLNLYLPDYLLTKLDRSTMYNSIEARTPFLDHDLSSYILKLPTRFKQNKNILRQLMRGRIPDEI